jgi:exosome complex RNA-binding protein Csl4
MANPNIVDVATINGGSLGWNLTGSLDSLITVTAEYILKVNRIVIANVDGTNGAEVDVAITFATGTQTGFTVNTTAATTAYLAKTVEVPADSSLVVTDTPIYLRAGDILKAKAEAVSDLDMFISYELLID